MNTELLEFYARTPESLFHDGEPFWDDPYISSQMLTAHLNPGLGRRFLQPLNLSRASAAWIASYRICRGKSIAGFGLRPRFVRRSPLMHWAFR